MRLGASNSTKFFVSGVEGDERNFTSLIDFSRVVIRNVAINYARVGARH